MRKAYVAAGWGWAAAIAWLSLTSAPPEVDIEYGDKLGHFAAYGLLMFWFCQLYGASKTRILYAAGFVIMGIGLELLQGELSYRTYELFDMYANALGVLLGWAGALALRKPLFH
jgi:VanZ family protein